MRKAVGVLLITLLLGSIVAAAGSTAYATTVEAQNDPYEKFWEILNREAELVVRLNATGNTTLVKELIQNSRFGAENAANISALIWQAMEELKASGVKTYYTAEELREMAQNISQNGLPQETVEALKAQGWTDEQVQALEDYIAKNAGEINEDFNMTAFLKDFSMAFIDVAFKYNEYGAWGLKTGYWKNIGEAPSTAGSSLQINPVLKRSWIETYASYYNYSGDSTGIETFYSSVRGLNELITALILDRIKPKEYEYTKFMPPHPTPRPPRNITLNISPPINPRLISPEQEITRVEKRTPNGGIVFTIEKTRVEEAYRFLKDAGGDVGVKSTPEVWCPETWIITNHTVYYWPSALEAYELSSNIMALLEAKKRGNNNPEIDKIINQKMAELKQSLGVYMIYSTNKTKRVSCYDNLKPGQPRPLSGLDTKETMPVEKASPDLQEPLNLPEWLIKEALDMENTLGVLSINGISVVVDRNDAGEIKYHVEISMVAKYNSVSKIQVNVSDKTSGGTDTGTISYLGPDEEETWRSGKFSARVSGSSIRITGNVKITYRPVCSSPPTSFKDGQTLSRKCQDRTITRSYSETIDLGSSIDWSKVDVIVTASRHNIVEGESVTYTVKVKNGNSLPVDGVKYRVTVSLPQFDPKNYSGTVTIPANGEKTILTKTVAYPDSGTYLARATISWNGHTKSASDKVIVTTGTLVISDVDVSPRNPDDGDRVRFDVSIRNPSSRSRSLNVKLFIDGVKEPSRTVSIGGNGESTTTLVWTATAGNHDWRVEVWEDGKLEDSRSGSIEVNFPAGSGVLKIKEVQVIPTPPTVKKPVTFRIKVKNLYSISKEAKISLEIPEMGFKTDLTKVIAPGDYGIFDIQWKPGEVGLIDVIIKVFSREDNGGEKLEDEEHETVEVRDNLFGRLVPNVNNTVVQGTMVHFDVIVENKDDYPAYNVPIRVLYTYQKPNGEFSDPIRIFERNPHRIDGLGVNLTWFNITLTNIGKYHFTLYVNGEIEDEKIITVNSEGNVMAWMECEDTVKLYKSFNCYVNLGNLQDSSIHVQLVEIKFGGEIIWNGEDWDSVKVSPHTGSEITLGPDESGTLEFTIWVDGELAKRIFGDEYYTYLFTPGGEPTSQWISAELQFDGKAKELGATVIIYPGDDEGGTGWNTLKTIGAVGGGVVTVIGVAVEINVLSGLGIFFLGLTVGPDVLRSINAPTPTCSGENDGNLICGDGG
ncbi:hypothetical protein [Thermococcus aciditolerans]|uniref:hypothetical protein n=1 Tax=Thermococcus aciditolerans TaxID=2598455 RepID=UPI001FE6DCD4|nr:hypothetical protein [Thermococcus aciditolerans]